MSTRIQARGLLFMLYPTMMVRVQATYVNKTFTSESVESEVKAV